MADDDFPLIDDAKGLYKRANDWISKIPTPGYKPPSQSADPGMVKDATDSFVHAAQTKAQKRPAVPPKVALKVNVKSSPRKQGD
jgi:hypothetical protein